MRHKICFLDLDGTVNSSSIVRDHLVPSQPMFEENWAAWHAAHIHEKPNRSVIRIVDALAKAGWKIVLLSMRGDNHVTSTHKQLSSWGVFADGWTLKSAGDNRSPGIFKKEEINAFRSSAHHMQQELDVLVIDDSPEVCEAVKSLPAMQHCTINVLQIDPFKG